MKSLLYVMASLAVLGLAFWAYRENYTTQQVLKETRGLQRQIGAVQVRLSVLRAEWAYLNRPDRLRELADLNFDRLNLLPLRPEQFGSVDEVAYPPDEDVLDFTNGVEVSSLGAKGQTTTGTFP
ncbi:cell division protein FtsL [Phaeobacter porticola]|uniref:Putative secreted (Periplasmic) protein n=1 Tax=Phaeobacter porticola TaxID=1844006 RepID=A0A1L3I2K0_9RHOB|nr:cell division protein FtsL [Phaeobacter porticola]APG46344.1 putative secreted (periplasmic) protein [Phaeobacter porticola]